MNKIKILIIVDKVVTGVNYFRLIQPNLFLQNKNPEDFEVTFKTDIVWGDLNFFDEFNIITLNRGVFGEESNDFINAIKYCNEHNIITVLDLDDYWKLDIHHPNYYKRLHSNSDKLIQNYITLFKYVTTTTEIFANQIRKLNKNVVVLPNAINEDDESFKIKKIPSEKIRFGFVMGSSHEHDLELLEGITSMLSKEELEKVQFVLCGFDLRGRMKTINIDTGEITERRMLPQETTWYRYEKNITSNYTIVSDEYKNYLLGFYQNVNYPNEDNEPYVRLWTKDINQYFQHYSKIDVLLAPLQENDFNKMKSQLKAIECAFSDTAIIASNVGPYTIDLKNMYEKGGNLDLSANALLVDSNKNNKNWLKFIRLLINNPKLIEILRNNLHDSLKDKYSLKNVNEQRRNFYKKIIEEK